MTNTSGTQELPVMPQPHASFADDLKRVLRGNIRQYTMIIALLAIWAIFAITTGGVFISSRNLSILFVQMCTTGILTGGMLLVMVAGHIDLSAGSVCGTLGALVAYMMARAHVSPPAAIAITLAAGLLVGAWHGFWVAYRGVPAFIVTLASQLAFRGLTLLITNGATIGEFNPGFKLIGQGFIPDLPIGPDNVHLLAIFIFFVAIVMYVIAELRKRKKRVSNNLTVLSTPLQTIKTVLIVIALGTVGFIFASYKGIPYAILILLVVVAFSHIVTTSMPFGRYVYAIGGNVEAARLSGVNIKKTIMIVFMIMGGMCSIAATVYTSRLNAATTAAGTGFELDAIAACIIGGTSTAGGYGTAIGAIIGALVMASLDNGMSLMNLPIMIQYMIKGMILLLAVWVDIANRKK